MSDIYTKDKEGRLAYTIKNKYRLNGKVVVIETKKMRLTPEEVRIVWNYIDLPNSIIPNEEDFTHLKEEEWLYILNAKIQEVTQDELDVLIAAVVIPVPATTVETIKPKRTRKVKEKT